MEQRQLPEDFKEFLSLLNENSVKYILVGGWAVGFYGYPRFTGDIDVFISVEKSNIKRLKIAMKEFGIPDFEDEMLTTPGHVFKIGRTPLLIEILNEISGANFDDCFGNKEFFKLSDGFEIPLISFEDLIKNKSSTDRAKDKADLEYLLEIKKQSEIKKK